MIQKKVKRKALGGMNNGREKQNLKEESKEEDTKNGRGGISIKKNGDEDLRRKKQL